jgi:Protein kinase domain
MSGRATAAAAILGLGALGAAAAAMLAGGSEAGRAEALATTETARTAVTAARDSTSRALVAEVAAAAAVPQLRAALANKVDTFTLDDLFQTEDWWAPHKARALVLVGPDGVIMSRNVAAGAPAAELAARATAAPGGAALARAGDQPFLVAAAPVAGEPAGRVLVLGVPVDGPLLDEWAGTVRAGLLLSTGQGAPRAGGGLLPGQPMGFVGREAEGVIVDATGSWVAAPVELSSGLWLWTVQPAGGGAGKAASSGSRVPLAGLAAALALAALGVALAGRRRAPAPTPESGQTNVAAAFAPTAAMAAPAMPAATPAAATPAGAMSSMSMPSSAAGTGVSGGRRPSINLPTMIASGEPQVFGRYTVLDRLGAGGMCDIYTAALTGPEGFQRTFVLKRLKPELALNRAACDQFIDEAKLGSTLVHSNIVPVFDFGRVGDGYFIAQEYIVGRNVAQLCERHQERLGEPLDIAMVFYIAHETLQALGYAHDKTNDAGEPMQIVHRDVSPGNVVVSRGGEVKLIDFGIVKAAGRVSHTDLGNVKGNASFMAPEQARGLNVDRRADLFSLGLVMYRALAGEPFYAGGTTAEVFYGAASGPTAEHFDRLDRLPPVAARILKKALMPDPADRYATAEDFAADLLPHVPAGAKASLATLVNALFGAELKSGGGPSGATGSLKRDAG